MTSMYAPFGVPAILTYLAAAGVLLYSLRQDEPSSAATQRWRMVFLALAWIAVSFHFLAIAEGYSRPAGLNLSFLSASSLVTAFIVFIVLLVSLVKPVEQLGIIVFPLAAIALGLKLALPEETRAPRDHSLAMSTHILVSMLAYSFLNIAALQALVLASQDWCLRNHRISRLVRSLPPLQTMEALLFQLIGAGFVLLSISLLTGFLFLEDLFAQHLAHKTTLSIAAWLVFAGLLLGRYCYGWRGATAIRWTLSGFASLMLAYFGSKMALEVILHRT